MYLSPVLLNGRRFNSLSGTNPILYTRGRTAEVGDDLVLFDQIGRSNGTVQLGRGYLGDGTAYVAIAGLLTTDTIEADSTDKPTCTLNGVLSIANTDFVYGVTIKRAGTIIGRYPCAEGSGSISINLYPALPFLSHGTITSATLSTFHATVQDGTGYDLNTYGYSVADSHATLADGVLIPAVEGTYTDPYGVAVQYPKPRLSPTVYGYGGTFDGTAYLAAANLAGTETVVSSDGTSTPTVGVGKIEFDAGTCSRVELDNGDIFIIQSTNNSVQTTVYNIGNIGDNATLTTATLPFFTTASTAATHLAQYGWREAANKFLYSGDFTNAAWSKTRVTVGAAVPGPRGELGYPLLCDSTANTTHALIQLIGAALLDDNETYYTTFIVKPSGSNWINISARNTDNVAYGAYFNILTGAIGNVSAEATASITHVSDGWYECSVGVDMKAGVTSYGAYLYIAEGDGDTNLAGNREGDGILISSPQLAKSLETAYIETTTAAIPLTYLPGTSAGVAADGNALTVLPRTLLALDAGYVNFPQAPSLIAADVGNYLFDASGDPNNLTDIYDNILAAWITSMPVNNTKGLAIYDPATSATILERAWRTLGSFNPYKFGLTFNQAAGETATVKLKTADASAITIDWGDGTVESATSNVNKSHTYVGAYNGKVTFRHTAKVTEFTASGAATQIEADIAEFPRTLTLLRSASTACAITGDIADAPSGLTSLAIFVDSSSITGDIADAPSGLTFMSIASNNSSITGDLADAPRSLTVFSLNNNDSAITGDIADAPPNLNTLYLNLTDSAITGTAGTVGFAAGTAVKEINFASNAMTQAGIDSLLIALATHATWHATTKTVNLGGTNPARTAASNAAKATLIGYGVTVTVNETPATVTFAGDADVTFAGDADITFGIE